MKKIITVLLFSFLLLSFSLNTGSVSAQTITPPNYKVAVIGDSGDSSGFQNVLNLIKSEGADFVLHEGDFSYSSGTSTWASKINNTLGPNFPYLGANGNHDNWSTYWNDFFRDRLISMGVNPTLDPGNSKSYGARYNGLEMVFVGDDSESTSNRDHPPFINQQFNNSDSIWKLCNWHRNGGRNYTSTTSNPRAMLSTGEKPASEMGLDTYDACRQQGAMILTGHEHSYERTKAISNFEHYDPSNGLNGIEIDTSQGVNDLFVTPGKTFVVVSGLGGVSKRDYNCDHHDNDWWWANIYALNHYMKNGSTVEKDCTVTGSGSRGNSYNNDIWPVGNIQNYTYGALFITFNVDGDPAKATAYFKNIEGQIIDEFTIRTDGSSGPFPTATAQPTPTGNPSSTPSVVPTPTASPVATASPIASPSPINGTQYTFSPSDDAHVKGSNPSSNYGSNSTLHTSDYSSNQNTSYLKFDLAAVDGNTIVGATLRFVPALSRRVSKTVKFVSNNNWSEGSITFNNAPQKEQALGSLQSVSVTSGQPVEIALDPTTIAPSAGKILTLALDNNGTGDTFEVNSSENPSGRPELIIIVDGDGPPQYNADVNGDGRVDPLDALFVIENYNNGDGSADINGDGKVNGFDYSIVVDVITNASSSQPSTQTSASPQASSSPTFSPFPTPTPNSQVYRAFTPDSYWNTPFPPDAPIDSNNDLYIADAMNTSRSDPTYLRLTGAPDHGSTGENWSYPIYWAGDGDPTYFNIQKSYGPDVPQVRIPRGATPQNSSDGAIIIYDIAWNQVVEFYQANYNSSSDTWSATSTKRYMLNSNGLSRRVAGSNSTINQGHRGQPSSIRAVRIDEVAAGSVDHRLECFWHDTGRPDSNTPWYYWPMDGYESGKGGIIPEGLVIRIKPSVNLDSKGLSPAARIIAQALKDYGCMIGDNEGGTKNSLKLERNQAGWAALDPNLSLHGLSSLPFSEWEVIQGGYLQP